MSRVSLAERFWVKVAVSGADRCWEWTGARRPNDGRGNYGIVRIDGKNVRAHRTAWFLTYGRWPELPVLHHCDNPPCCNPSHLFEGTLKENSQDCLRKGRARRVRGECNSQSKLTADQVRMIRHRYHADSETVSVIAADYAVTPSLISQIGLRRIWTHV